MVIFFFFDFHFYLVASGLCGGDTGLYRHLTATNILGPVPTCSLSAGLHVVPAAVWILSR